MRLVHSTLLGKRGSIMEKGILGSYAVNSDGKVWLHEPELNQWAETHVRDRHNGEGETVVHIYVEIPAYKLKKHGGGRYYTIFDIFPDSFVGEKWVNDQFCIESI